MFSSQHIDYTNKANFYRELAGEVEGLMTHTWFSNLANVSALLMSQLPRLNWAGFYLFTEGELRLGPFQGLPACLNIAIGRGVCGAAAERRASVVVPDVEAFPGHIACDTRSRSEIVVPLVAKTTNGERLLGVLDLDSPELARFDDEDRIGLEEIARILVTKTVWPGDFLAGAGS